MAWRIPLTSVTAGTNQNLGTTDNLYISTGVTVGATAANAVLSNGSNHSVYVYGTAVSAGGNTIQIEGNFSTDTNCDVRIGQFGRVDALDRSGVVIHTSNSSLTNNGEIIAARYGVASLSQDANSVFKIGNAGTISAGISAIIRDSATAAETLTIINSGLITGVSYSIDGLNSNGKELITNTGTIIGAMKLDGGDDVYNGINGHQSGQINGGAGIDKLYGGTENNTFHGDAGADILMGYGGNDTLYGDSEGDILNGGAGADSLYGGTGLDNFVFTAFTDSTVATAGQDTIFDFSHAEGDKINLAGIDARAGTVANEAFTFIGTAAFSGVKGQLHYSSTPTDTYISGDINGDKVADFMIHLAGQKALVIGDFIL